MGKGRGYGAGQTSAPILTPIYTNCVTLRKLLCALHTRAPHLSPRGTPGIYLTGLLQDLSEVRSAKHLVE